ncbi:PhnD/SsuA/transferrin family substrate-binding protein [bacterium]|nr:PhnD/SsuA/transferrin family substrate-binding protein [bacterium]
MLKKKGFIRYGSVWLGMFFLGAGLMFASPSQAYFIDAVYGVRPAGMGEAFVGIADDANTVLFNPAGISGMKQVEVMGMYSRLYMNLDDRQYTGNQDRIGYSLAATVLPFADAVGSFGLAWSRFYSELYGENQFYLSYARNILKAYNIDLGITLKVLNWSVSKTAYTESYSEWEKWGGTLDAGILSSPFEGFQVGISADNLVPADMGLYSEAITPVALRVGAAYFLPWEIDGLESMRTQLELHARNESYNIKFGFETWLAGKEIGLRTGVNLDQVTLGFSYWKKLSSQPFELHFDYAFAYPFYVMETIGSHRAGVTLSWDPHYSRQQLAAAVHQATQDKQAISRRLEETSHELEASEMEITGLEEKVSAMQEELQRAKQARRERQAEAEVRAQKLDRDRAEQYPVNINPVIVIGYETKLLSDYAYIQAVREQVEKLEIYLKQQTGYTFVRRGFSSPEEITYAFQQGEIDIAIPSSGIFSTLYKQGIADPFLTFTYQGKDFQKYLLFVREDNPIMTLNELKQKKVGYLNSLCIKRLERYLSQSLPNYPSGKFFKTTRKMDSARGGIMALRLQDIDVLVGLEYIETILRRETEGNQGIRILDKYGFGPNAPVFIRTGLREDKRKKIKHVQDILLNAHTVPECSSFMKFFFFDKISLFQEEKYEQFFKDQ